MVLYIVLRVLRVLRVAIHLKNGEFNVTRGVTRVTRCNSRLKYKIDPVQIRETCRGSMKSRKLICKLI